MKTTAKDFFLNLLVVAGLYISAGFLERMFRKNEEMRRYWVRVWLLYLTLFIAGAVMIGDLVAVIYNFLNGDLTLRFLLKVGALLLIAGTVFKYYFLELLGREKWQQVQHVIAFAAM